MIKKGMKRRYFNNYNNDSVTRCIYWRKFSKWMFMRKKKENDITLVYIVYSTIIQIN